MWFEESVQYMNSCLITATLGTFPSLMINNLTYSIKVSGEIKKITLLDLHSTVVTETLMVNIKRMEEVLF